MLRSAGSFGELQYQVSPGREPAPYDLAMQSAELPRGTRARLIGVISVSLVLIAAGLVQPHTSAHGIINAAHGCSDTTLSWRFDGSNWTGARENYVKAAFDGIETALDYDGTQLVSLTENESPAPDRINVQIVDLGEDLLGWAQCPGGGQTKLQFGLSYVGQGASFFYQVARHEMLHLIGLDHGGQNDSMDGRNPASMATCTGPGNFRDTADLDRDAEVGLNWRYSSLSDRQVSANIGFENGTNEWGGTNGSLASYTGGSFSGDKLILFAAEGDSSDSYVRQTVRIWTGWDTYAEFRPYLRARAHQSGPSTNVRASLYRKGMWDGSNPGCTYRLGLQNVNDVTLASTLYILVSQSDLTSVGTSWTAVSGEWADPPTFDGYELQLRAYGNSAGDYSVRFDNVRVDER